MQETLRPILEDSYPSEFGCFNTNGFMFFLGRQLAESNRYGLFSAFLLFRIEKESNGENLKQLVRCLRWNTRETDYIGKVDGETIGVILQHANVDNASRVLGRLKEEAGPVLRGEGLMLQSACAVFPSEANTMNRLKDLAEGRLAAS